MSKTWLGGIAEQLGEGDTIMSVAGTILPFVVILIVHRQHMWHRGLAALSCSTRGICGNIMLRTPEFRANL